MAYSYLTDRDLNSPEDVEQIRRSIAMLPTGLRAVSREDALLILAALAKRLRLDVSD